MLLGISADNAFATPGSAFVERGDQQGLEVTGSLFGRVRGSALGFYAPMHPRDEEADAPKG